MKKNQLHDLRSFLDLLERESDLLVIEAGTGRLLKVAPDSGQMMVIMENLSAAFSSQLLSPVAQVAQASDGAIYVSEPGASSFSVIGPRY